MVCRELANYDIFILPSYYETFGRVYFEAMAAGIPVICAKNSGIYGYFKESVEGFSVDHKDINDICSKLELLIKDPSLRTQIGRNARKLVEAYTWENVVQELHQIYIDSTETDSDTVNSPKKCKI